MAISEIGMLATLPSTTRMAPAAASEVAVEFDTMIWELMLRESGLLRPFLSEGGTETAMLGEVFLQDFARQLAAQVDIGFGRMALAATSEIQNTGNGK